MLAKKHPEGNTFRVHFILFLSSFAVGTKNVNDLVSNHILNSLTSGL